MINFPFLTLLLLMPVIGVLVIIFIQGTKQQVLQNTRAVALWTSFVTLLIYSIIWFEFDSAKSSFQLVHQLGSINAVGLQYVVGVDGISLLMLLLTTLLMPLVILTGWHSVVDRPKLYYVSLLSLETFVIGAFISLNSLMFYVFFESVLIPMLLLIGIWGGEFRIHASIKFFIYTFLGSILMLSAFLIIGAYVGSFNMMEWSSTIEESFVGQTSKAIWWLLAIGFAVKIPMFPLHTWLPKAHVEAPSSASMILAGVLLKLGAYAMIRFHLLAFPQLSAHYFPVIATVCIVGLIYASLIAWVQKDMKRLVAFSSIAHMSFVVLGIYSQSALGVTGAVIQMMSHGVISAGLFFVVDMLYQRTHTREISAYGGIVHTIPKISVIAFLLVLGLISVPLTSGFVGEVMVMLSVFKISPVFGVLIALGVILAPIYGLTFYRNVFLGPLETEFKKLPDISLREMLIAGVLVVFMLWIGIYPSTFTQVLEPTALHIIKGV